MRYILIILFLFNVASAQSLFGVVAGDGNTDVDAKRFIDSAQITNSTQKRAVNYLVKQLKAQGLWTVMQGGFIYPMVGGTADAHSRNLLSPGPTSSDFYVVWTNVTHSSDGVAFAGTATSYGNTRFNPSSSLSGLLNDNHLSYYTKTSDATALNAGGFGKVEMGVQVSTNYWWLAAYSYSNASYHISGTTAAAVAPASTNSQGFWIGSRTSSTRADVYKNGSSVGNSTATNAGSMPNGDLFLGTNNSSGSYTEGSNRQCAFASGGKSLTSSQALALYNIVQQYQTILGRQN